MYDPGIAYPIQRRIIYMKVQIEVPLTLYISLSVQEEGVALPPDRLFKIVLVGNSSVGKTSLLRRFCDDCFYPGTSATVGEYTILHTKHTPYRFLWTTGSQEI